MRDSLRLPEFFADAACAGDPRPSAWTATDTLRGPQTWRSPENLRAVEVCGGCAIRVECLDWALSQESLDGPEGAEIEAILGGLTPYQRRSLRAARLRLRFGLG